MNRMDKKNRHISPFVRICVLCLAASAFFSCTPVRAEIPDIFAFSESRGKLRIYSPDGLKITVRAEKNTPQKDSEFWAGALENQLEKKGYLLEKKERFSSANLNGISLLWVVPFGHEYYSYMTALAVKGRKIYIMEAAGEQKLFERYEKEIAGILSSLAAK